MPAGVTRPWLRGPAAAPDPAASLRIRLTRYGKSKAPRQRAPGLARPTQCLRPLCPTPGVRCPLPVARSLSLRRTERPLVAPPDDLGSLAIPAAAA